MILNSCLDNKRVLFCFVFLNGQPDLKFKFAFISEQNLFPNEPDLYSVSRKQFIYKLFDMGKKSAFFPMEI